MSIHRGFPVAAEIARRALVLVALAGLAGAPLLFAHAQTAPQANTPPADSNSWPGPSIASQTAQDPPGRVGRIAKLNGTVSFHTTDQDQWSPATLNYPLTSGNALWTEPGARAEVQIGDANRLVMDSGTELDVTTLDDHTMQANLPQGAAYLRVHDTAPGDEYAIQTPRGTLHTTTAGRYALTAGDADHPTIATVIEGSAQLTGPNTSLLIPAGQMVSLTGPIDGSGPVQTAMTPMRSDDPFIASAMKEDRNDTPPPVAAAPTPQHATAQPAIPQQELAGMTGAQDLANTGTWTTAPQYGSVWYPPVDPGWVPYRYGHWAYVPPWGWTWVADEPWGFAPFHYGRWVEIDDRWAWTPGVYAHYGYARPVYAPALVAFFGGDGWSVSIFSGSNVGWVPLGPREVYYPPYRCSRTYMRTVNITHVTNVTNITNVTNVRNVTVSRYANNRGATIVPASAMTGSRHIQRAALPVEQRQYAKMRPNMQAPLKPTNATLGLAKPERHAPGPQIRSTAFQAERGGRTAPMHSNAAPAARPLEPRVASREAPERQTPARQTPAPRNAEPAIPAPRPMSREQAHQQGNARHFDAKPQSAPRAPQTASRTAPQVVSPGRVTPQVEPSAPRGQARQTRQPPAGMNTANRTIAPVEPHRPTPQAKPQPSQQQMEMQRQAALRRQDMQRQQESQRQLQLQQQQAVQRQQEVSRQQQQRQQQQQAMQRQREMQQRAQIEAQRQQQTQRSQQAQRQIQPQRQQAERQPVQRQQEMQRQAPPQQQHNRRQQDQQPQP